MPGKKQVCGLVCWLVVLNCNCGRGAEPESRAKYGPQAVRLFTDHAYLQQHPAPDYWAIAPYYLSQRDDRSCSLACATMLINAARVGSALSAQQQLATQDEVLEKSDSKLWRAGLGEGGEGVTLAELAELLRLLYPRYGMQNIAVTLTPVPAASPAALQQLRKTLQANEGSAADLLLVNVLQSELTGDPEGAVGHFLPVAAYDAKQDRVLLMDPDRRWYEPYWVSTSTLLKALATQDAVTKQPRGYLWIQRKEKE